MARKKKTSVGFDIYKTGSSKDPDKKPKGPQKPEHPGADATPAQLKSYVKKLATYNEKMQIVREKKAHKRALRLVASDLRSAGSQIKSTPSDAQVNKAKAEIIKFIKSN